MGTIRSGDCPLPAGSLLLAAALLLGSGSLSTLGAESCGTGNLCPVVDSLSTNPGIFAPGQAGEIAAAAHDPDRALTRYDFSATDGSFPNGTTSDSVTTSATSTTIPWTAPLAAGTYAITVRVWDNGGYMGFPTSGNVSTLTIPVTVTDLNHAPVISGVTATPDRVFVGNTASLTASATDSDGDPITWSWSTTLGTVTPGAPGAATFLAPAWPGIAVVTATATDSFGAASSKSVTIPVGSSTPDRELAGVLVAPSRLAVDSWGNLFVVDRAAGGISILNATTGSLQARLPLPQANSVAVDWNGRILVGTPAGASLHERNGELVSVFTAGEDLGPATDVAIDASGQRYVVLYGDSGRVVVYSAARALQFAFGGTGDGPGQFRSPRCLAVSPAGEILVGDTGHGLVQVFDVTGNLLRTFGGRGDTLGQFTQLQGLAVDVDGAVFASDAFQSRVQVFNPDGTLREVVGEYGQGVGRFQTPAGLALLPTWKKLAVASANSSAVEIFDFQGASVPPTNTAPTMPMPVSPADGAVLPAGTPVVLSTADSFDPDYQALRYHFELYASDGVNPPVLVDAWLLAEESGSTSIDVSSRIVDGTAYYWRVRAFDGVAFSGWSQTRGVQVDPGSVNHAPTSPALEWPLFGDEIADLAPSLTTSLATDADLNPLTYQFEVAVLVDGAFRSLATSPAVPPSGSAATWTVPAGILGRSQDVFWRARSFDGLVWSAWADWSFFFTPAFPLPEAGEWGDIPGGDRTRAGSVRYVAGPLSDDTTIRFQLFDVTDPSELSLLVNGTGAHAVGTGAALSWSLTLAVTIPAAELDPAGPNWFEFVHSGSGGSWGVRSVRLGGLPIPVLHAEGWNTVIDVSWDPEPTLPSGTKIRLYRGFAAAGPWAFIGDFDPADGIRRDTGLDNDLTYFYRAEWLVPAEAEGVPSAPVSAVASAANGPTPITDLRVIRLGDDLELYWSPITSSPSISRFEIYRDTCGSWSPDTTNHQNLWGTVSPFDGKAVVLGGARTDVDQWYSVFTLDITGARARK